MEALEIDNESNNFTETSTDLADLTGYSNDEKIRLALHLYHTGLENNSCYPKRRAYLTAGIGKQVFER